MEDIVHLQMKNKNVTFGLMIFYIIYTLKAWFFLYPYDVNWRYIIGPLLLFLVIFDKQMFRIDKKTLLFVILALYAACYSGEKFNFNLILGNFFMLSGVFSVICLRKQYWPEFIKIFERILIPITIISAIGWILFLLKIPLPYKYYTWEPVEGSYYEFYNYFVFLYCHQPDVVFPRFSSIFFEPGYYACFIVFLITYHHFNYKKKEVWIYSIALVLSFSLAGFFMYLIALIGFTLLKNKYGILYIVFIIEGVNLFQVFFETYNKGDNIINNLILTRTVIEDGAIAGYNRTGEAFDEEFIEFVKRGGNDFWWGASKSKQKAINVANVGWKVYMYRYGFICFAIYIICIFVAYWPYKKERNAAIYVILFIMFFGRGHYEAWFAGFWMVYLSGMANEERERTLTFKNKENGNTKFQIK